MSARGPIFIGGFTRSGTTLLRYIIDSHPHITCGPESKNFIPELRLCIDKILGSDILKKSLKNFMLTEGDIYRFVGREPISSFFDPTRIFQNKLRWASKTPTNCLHFDFLGRAFPDAYFILMIRDGRDCVCSLDKVEWAGRILADQCAFDSATRSWAEWTTTAMTHGQNLERYIEVHYESLTSNPRIEIQRILDFLEEPWHDNLLAHFKRSYVHEVLADERNTEGAKKPIETTSVGRWQIEMTEKQVKRFCTIAGSLLQELGYEVGANLPKGDAYKKAPRRAPLSVRGARWIKKMAKTIA
jgi:protein-tyrosine sulfotransferase